MWIYSWHKKESHAAWWTCSTLILRLWKNILLWLSIWWAQNQPNNPPAFNIIWKMMMKIKNIIFIMFAELILWIRTSESLEAEAIWWKLADKTGQSKFRYWNLRKIYRKKKDEKGKYIRPLEDYNEAGGKEGLISVHKPKGQWVIRTSC